ncbi:type II secretion system F family protein [Myxococcota bacterium]|nr:type II secretion system F family protein [Myxococcota bacterium]
MLQRFWQGLVTAPPMAVVLGLVALLLWTQLAVWWWSGRNRQRQEELRRRLGLDLARGGPSGSLFLKERRYARSARLDGFLRGLPGMAFLHDLIERAEADATVSGLLRKVAVFAAVGVAASYAVIHDPVVQLAAAAALGALPVLRLVSEAAARVDKLWRQLPDALDLMTRSLRAGHGTGAALHLVAAEMPLPIAGEFARTFERYRLGEDLGQALQAMADRNRVCRDLRFFAIAVGLQRETGGNLVEILENLARTVRSRFVLQAKVQALTSEARLSTRVVGSMPFLTLGALFVMRRPYLDLAFGDPIGRGMIFGGFAWFAVGLLMMNRVMKVEV